ncbi:MAG: hypothetical protein VYE68_08840 [Acidobacteriota bacterium]|nr:hypothetical protein [Acidobacteriota bacterium]
MSSQLEPVLEISAYGTVILFAALAGLIGLMYMLTAQWPGQATQWLLEIAPGSAPSPTKPAAEALAEAERDRRRRALAIAVAVACATTQRAPIVLSPGESPWRQMHHARRLSQATARTRSRS